MKKFLMILSVFFVSSSQAMEQNSSDISKIPAQIQSVLSNVRENKKDAVDVLEELVNIEYNPAFETDFFNAGKHLLQKIADDNKQVEYELKFSSLKKQARDKNNSQLQNLLKLHDPYYSDVFSLAKEKNFEKLNQYIHLGLVIDFCFHKSFFKRKTVLEHAVWNKDSDLASFCINAGANMNKLNLLGVSLLHSVASSPKLSLEEKKQAINFLLKHGADINIKDKLGRTPLFCAIAFEPFDSNIEHFLIEKGANQDMLTDNFGQTAKELRASNIEYYAENSAKWLNGNGTIELNEDILIDNIATIK